MWFGNYLMITMRAPKDTITAEFPMVERTERYHAYTIRFKGNTVVDISSRKHKHGMRIGPGEYPIYLRDYMKGDKAPMKKVTRSVASNLIKW